MPPLAHRERMPGCYACCHQCSPLAGCLSSSYPQRTLLNNPLIFSFSPPPPFSSSRQCQPPFPPMSSVPQKHSPMSSQASSVTGTLHTASLAPLSTSTASQSLPATPPSHQQLMPDAFAIVQRAQEMVEMLSEDNEALQKELEGYYEKADKLQKVHGGS